MTENELQSEIPTVTATREFILARTAEWEATEGGNREVRFGQGAPPYPHDLFLIEGRWTDRAGRDWTDAVVAWTEALPLTPLAEQARRAATAYRLIVDRHRPAEALQRDEDGETLIAYCDGCGALLDDDYPCPDLAALAQIWLGHPDYPLS